MTDSVHQATKTALELLTLRITDGETQWGEAVADVFMEVVESGRLADAVAVALGHQNLAVCLLFWCADARNVPPETVLQELGLWLAERE